MNVSIAPSVLGKYFSLNKCDKYVVYHNLGLENAVWGRRDTGALLSFEESFQCEMNDIALKGTSNGSSTGNSEYIKGSLFWKLGSTIDDSNPYVNRQEWHILSPQNSSHTKALTGYLRFGTVGTTTTTTAIVDSISHMTFHLDKRNTQRCVSRIYGAYVQCTVDQDRSNSTSSSSSFPSIAPAIIVARIPPGMTHTQDRHIRTGIAWEQYLVDQLLTLCGESEGRWTLAMGSSSSDGGSDTRLTEAETLRLLASTVEPGHTTVMYQPTLIAGPQFYRMYGLAPPSGSSGCADAETSVRVSRCYPDFVMLEGLPDGRTRLTIIDAKGSQNVASSHKVQIAFYSLIFRSVLEEHDLEHHVTINTQGYVWLRPSDFEVAYASSDSSNGLKYDIGRRTSDFPPSKVGTSRAENSPHSSPLPLPLPPAACKRLAHIRETLSPFDLEAPETLVQSVLRSLFGRLRSTARADIEDLTQFGDHCTLCTYGPCCQRSLSRDKGRLEVYQGITTSDACLAAAYAPSPLVTGTALQRVLESGACEDTEVELRLCRVAAVLDAAEQEAPVLRGCGTDTFALGEDVSVFLTIVTDKPSRKVCCWGVKAFFRSPSAAASVATAELCERGGFVRSYDGDGGDGEEEEGSYSLFCAGTSAGKCLQPPWSTGIDSAALCRDLVLSLHRVFDAISKRNAAHEKELKKAKTAETSTYTYDDPSMLTATLFVADTDQADILRSILWGIVSAPSSADDTSASVKSKAESLLLVMYGNEGSLIRAPMPPLSYLRYRRPALVRLVPEVARLYALGSTVLGNGSGLEAWARAFCVLPSSSSSSSSVGADSIVELWSMAGVWDSMQQRAALGETLAAMEGVASAARTIASTDPSVSARIPSRPVRFDWAYCTGANLSQVRRECVFMAQHEAYIDYADKYATRALRSIRDHLHYGSMYLLTQCDTDTILQLMEVQNSSSSSASASRRRHAPPKNPEYFCISQATQRGLETKRDRTFTWWLIPYNGGEEGKEGNADEDASILRTLSEFHEYFLNFCSQKSAFVPIPAYSRVIIDQNEPFYALPDGRTVLHVSHFLKGKDFDRTRTHYLLTPSPYDVNAPRMVRALQDTAAEAQDELGGRASFEEIVEHPCRWATAPFEDTTLREKALEILASGDYSLTPSQHAAVERILGTHLQLLWGPPGTGKTQVLGVLVTVLARAAAELSRPLRVLVTALSHSNIDGLLTRIHSVSGRNGAGVNGGSGLPAIGRFDRTSKCLDDWSPGSSGCKEDDDEDCGNNGNNTAPQKGRKASKSKSSSVSGPKKEQQKIAWLEAHPICVIGGTVWQTISELLSADDSSALGMPFDVVLWDDASQSKTEDLAIYAHLLSRTNGRLVLAGDPLQLPPIVRGVYSSPASSSVGLFGVSSPAGNSRGSRSRSSCGAPLVTKSVYECIEGYAQSEERGGGGISVLRSALLENWRMNSEISTLLQTTLYSAIDYHTAKADDENSHIPMPDIDAACDVACDCLCPEVLSPEKSVCVLCVQLPQLQSQSPPAMHPEAPLIAALVRTLCAALHADPADPAVWEDLLFLICPHHSQIAAVSRALGVPAARPLTVERAQGLERDIVIADYALFNNDVIKNELEFLFSTNRMNVCLSRARKKCVFVVSEALLGNTGGFDILASPAVERGYLFLQKIVAHAKKHEAFVNVRLEDSSGRSFTLLS